MSSGAAELRARADRERKRRSYKAAATALPTPAAARTAGVPKPAAHKHEAAIPADPICPCGRPNSHGGRCWSRRGLRQPDASEPREPTVEERLDKLEQLVAQLCSQLNVGASR